MSRPSAQTPFRNAALAKIRSPEQLDALLPVTSPLGWLALLTLGGVIAAALVWGFYGTILRTTVGEGILIRNGQLGIMSIGSASTGPIEEILIHVGDSVEKGQILFRLDMAQTRQQIASGKVTLAALQQQNQTQRKDEEERLHFLKEKLANQEALYSKGLLTKTPLIDSRTLIYDVQNRQYQRDQQILEYETRLNELEIRLNQEGVVRAPYAGEVLEVDVNLGDYASPGRALARMQSLEGDPEAIIYVRAGEGKKIKPGMAIRIAPSTVRPEEFGTIAGRVKEVSMYPISRDSMETVLGNETMITRLLQSGEVIALIATLEEDPKSPSGFRWSSGRGPDLSIEGGTLCRASIVLERQRPAALLVPFLKKQLGLGE